MLMTSQMAKDMLMRAEIRATQQPMPPHRVGPWSWQNAIYMPTVMKVVFVQSSSGAKWVKYTKLLLLL